MGIFSTIKTLWRKKPVVVDKKSETSGIDDFKYKTGLELRFQDFDMMGHVNNAVYFTLLEIGRTKYWKQAIGWNWEKTGVIIARASIDYIQPVFINDKINIYVRTSRIGNSSFDLEYILVKQTGNTEVICSRGQTVCIAFDYQKKQPVSIPEIERNKMLQFEQLDMSTRPTNK